MKKRIVSLLLCLVLCVCMLPQTAFAAEEAEVPEEPSEKYAEEPSEKYAEEPSEKYAEEPSDAAPEAAAPIAEITGYQEGDIPGTRGTGTESNPVVCDSYEELRAALEDERFTYVKLKEIREYSHRGDVTVEGSSFVYQGICIGGTKVLTLDGKAVFTAVKDKNGDSITDLFVVGSGGSLSVKGNGEICYRLIDNGYVFINYGELNTYDGIRVNVTYQNGTQAFGRAIGHSRGTLNIYGGKFTSDIPQDSAYAPVYLNSGTGNISGGDFRCTLHGTQRGAGLEISNAANASISGGVFHRGLLLPGSKTNRDYIASNCAFQTESDGTLTVYYGSKVVTKVSPEGVTPPRPQYLIDPTAEAPYGAKYSVSPPEWYTTSGTKLATYDNFVAGQSYKVRMTMTAASDWRFAGSSMLRAALSGVSTAYTAEITEWDDYEVTVEYTFPRLTGTASDPCNINRVDLYVRAPAEGFHPGEAVSKTELVTVESTTWATDGSSGGRQVTSSDVFEMGKTYTIAIVVKAADGAVFGSSPTVYINDRIWASKSVSGNTLVASAELTAPNPPLVQITIPGYGDVWAGNTPANTFRFDNYSSTLLSQGVKLVKWYPYALSGATVNMDTVFVRGERYGIAMELQLLPASELADYCKFSFNDGYKVSEVRISGRTITLWDELQSPKVKLEHVSIRGYETIKAGKTPAQTFKFAANNTANAGQGVKITQWYAYRDSSPADRIANTDAFEAEKLYSVCVVLEPVSGYGFSETCTFDFNGAAEWDQEYGGYSRSDNHFTVWTVPVEPIKEITHVSIPGYSTIKVGNTPKSTFTFSKMTETYAGEHVALTNWHAFCDTEGREMNESDTFALGEKYSVYVALNAIDGYVFADDCIFDFCGLAEVDNEYTKLTSKTSARIWSVPVEPQEPFYVQCGCTCSFDECLAVNYYVPDSDLVGYSNVRLAVTFEKWTGSTQTFSSSVYLNWTAASINGTPCHKFVFSGISAPEVGNRIFTCVVAEKNGKEYRSPNKIYSVSDYCYNMLKSSSSDAGLKKLCANVLNYGAAAQVYFNVNPGVLCNAGMTAAQRQLAGNNVTVHDTSSTAAFNGVKLVNRIGKSVNFASAPELIVILELKTGVDGGILRLRSSYDSLCRKKTVEDTLMLTKSDSYWRASLCGFASGDMCQPVTVTVYDDKGNQVSDTVTYSLECYCYKMLHTAVTDENRAEMEKLQPLCQQMMNYSAAAKDYFVK